MSEQTPSETPLTDAEYRPATVGKREYVAAEFAEGLEKKLRAEKERADNEHHAALYYMHIAATTDAQNQDLRREIDRLSAALERARELFDLLDREANEEPILLHDGRPGIQSKGFRGLGLKHMNRTLREALEQWRDAALADGEQTAKDTK